MGIRIPRIPLAKQILQPSDLAPRTAADVPKGHLAVNAGENQKGRFVVPVSYLNNPSFQELLSLAEDEVGFDHTMGGLRLPCTEDSFTNLFELLMKIAKEVLK